MQALKWNPQGRRKTGIPQNTLVFVGVIWTAEPKIETREGGLQIHYSSFRWYEEIATDY